MTDLKTLREDAAKTGMVLRDLTQAMLGAELNLAELEVLEETDQTRSAVDYSVLALYNAGFVKQRLSQRLEHLHAEIRAAEQAAEAARLLKSHAALVAALNAALEAAEEEPHCSLEAALEAAEEAAEEEPYW